MDNILRNLPEEKLIDELQVRPGSLQRGLVLLGVELGAVGRAGGREGAEEVAGEHVNYLQHDTCFSHSRRFYTGEIDDMTLHSCQRNSILIGM